MKKIIKGALVVFLIMALMLCAFFIYFQIITAPYKLDKNKLISFVETASFYDDKDNLVLLDGSSNNYTKITNIPDHVKNAFIAVEDKRFYNHNGIDYKGLFRALINNIKTSSFKQGGSSISQQLIKNTHLSSEKTLKRKLVEIKLTLDLESRFSKDEILEKYLNTIYFGENCFGIEVASRKYFNKSPNELTVSEGALLAGVIKAPTIYSPFNNKEKAIKRRNVVLDLMEQQGYLTKSQLDNAKNESIWFYEHAETNVFTSYLKKAQSQAEKILELSPYALSQCKIYTYLNQEMQNDIVNNINSYGFDFDKTVAVADNKNHSYKAYYSTVFDNGRQLGSVIKPLVCYAPCVEEGIVSECSPVIDEKCDFNGYSPSNYANKYLGKTTVNEALCSSSNVVAVKLLKTLGVDKAKNYLSKMKILLSENDNSLSLALGSVEKGVTLTELLNAYSVLTNNGNFNEINFVRKIKDRFGNVIYERNNKEENVRVFSEDTVEMLNYMLNNTVKNGTSKKLDGVFDGICAKTGTVGGKNGNTDAYNVSYCKEYTVGVRLSEKEGCFNENITGGGYPSCIARDIWEKLNGDYSLSGFETSKLKKVFLDKESFEKEQVLVLADTNCPNQEKLEGFVLERYQPKSQSTRFTLPCCEKPKSLLNSNGISVELCQIEYYGYIVERTENGKNKITIKNIQPNEKCSKITDINLTNNFVYEYFITPYYNNGNSVFYGRTQSTGKIKYIAQPKQWWQE